MKRSKSSTNICLMKNNFIILIQDELWFVDHRDEPDDGHEAQSPLSLQHHGQHHASHGTRGWDPKKPVNPKKEP